MKPENLGEYCTNVYLYDGSFDGLLTAVFDGWNDSLLENIISEERYQHRLTDSTVSVCSDQKKAARIRKWIIKNFGDSVLIKIYKVFLTEEDGCERDIFLYLRYIGRKGKSGIFDMANKFVNRVDGLERAYNGETHKLYGFLRFRELPTGILLAEIGPKYNQLEPLIVFFHDRQPGARIIIYDTKRKLGAVCNGNGWYLSSALEIDEIRHDGTVKEDFEKMWTEYLTVLSINERENYKLQRQMMPMRYRQFMTEFTKQAD